MAAENQSVSRSKQRNANQKARKRTGAKAKSGSASKPRRGDALPSDMLSTRKRNVLACLLVVLGVVVFYYCFVRPYAYRWRPCGGMRGYGVCMPCRYEVHGLDISHYQGKVDWHRLTHSADLRFPLHFIFLKATEGGDYADVTFRQNLDSARRYGLMCGAYHYFNPATDAVRQADFFIERADLAPGDLPPVLDVETVGHASAQELRTAVKQWLDRVEAHYGVKPVLYTSYKFKNRYLSDSVFDAYPYWIAHYYVDSVRYSGRWLFWQHTDAGRVPGIDKEVDLNVFNGTLEQLRALTVR